MRDPFALSTPEEARAVVRARARTFYLASLFLPGAVRRDVHVVYAFCRAVDDLVDEPPGRLDRGGIAALLDEVEAGLCGGAGTAGSLIPAVLAVSERYGIPRKYFLMLVEGARRDLHFVRIASIEDLREYSLLVAGSVGMLMAHILGAYQEEALVSARDLGIAMQITNVLRDVGEDLERGRIYLPASELERVGCSPHVLYRRQVTPEFVTVMRLLSEEARERYRSGTAGIRYLHRRAQYSIFLAATLYAGILDKIEERNFDVFSGRAHLDSREKWLSAVPAYRDHRRARAGW